MACSWVRVMLMLVVAVLITRSAAASASSSSSSAKTSAGQMEPHVRVDGPRLLVDGEPFVVKGVCYSPTPIGQWAADVTLDTPANRAMWARDLPLIAAMGANTVRVYRWTPSSSHAVPQETDIDTQTARIDLPHSAFLDACERHRLHVIISYPLEPHDAGLLHHEERRREIRERFVAEVARYRHHAAVLGWALGHEVNGAWTTVLAQLSAAYTCGWSSRCVGASVREGGKCAAPIACVYSHLFAWANEAADRVHQIRGPPVILSLADTDEVLDRLAQFSDPAGHRLDMFGLNIYRGRSLHDALVEYSRSASKPLVVLEFGVDVYSDPCGTERGEKTCTNTFNESLVDELTQAVWDMGLASELLTASKSGGPVVGGCLFEWSDEPWKNADSNIKGCIRLPDGFACAPKAHMGCPATNLSDRHALCGYPARGAPDGYSNEGWWGVMAPHPNLTTAGAPDILVKRAVYARIQSLWVEPPPPHTTHDLLWLLMSTLVLLALAAATYVYRHFVRAHRQSDYDQLAAATQDESTFEDGTDHAVPTAGTGSGPGLGPVPAAPGGAGASSSSSSTSSSSSSSSSGGKSVFGRAEEEEEEEKLINHSPVPSANATLYGSV